MSDVSLKCNFLNENHTSIEQPSGKFHYENSDSEFLLSQVTKLTLRPDRIKFTKILNLKNQTMKTFKNGVALKEREIVCQNASAIKLYTIVDDLFIGSGLLLDWKNGKLPYQGAMNINNDGNDHFELEADISTIFCLGLLDVGDLRGKKIPHI